jgi:hypothetical protein
MKSGDEDFKKLEDIVLRKREDDLIKDLEEHRRDREHDKIMSDLDERAFMELLQESTLK